VDPNPDPLPGTPTPGTPTGSGGGPVRPIVVREKECCYNDITYSASGYVTCVHTCWPTGDDSDWQSQIQENHDHSFNISGSDRIPCNADAYLVAQGYAQAQSTCGESPSCFSGEYSSTTVRYVHVSENKVLVEKDDTAFESWKTFLDTVTEISRSAVEVRSAYVLKNWTEEIDCYEYHWAEEDAQYIRTTTAWFALSERKDSTITQWGSFCNGPDQVITVQEDTTSYGIPSIKITFVEVTRREIQKILRGSNFICNPPPYIDEDVEVGTGLIDLICRFIRCKGKGSGDGVNTGPGPSNNDPPVDPDLTPPDEDDQEDDELNNNSNYTPTNNHPPPGTVIPTKAANMKTPTGTQNGFRGTVVSNGDGTYTVTIHTSYGDIVGISRGSGTPVTTTSNPTGYWSGGIGNVWW